MTDNIRVVAADDHPEVLARICRVVEAMPGVEIVGSATNGQEAVTLTKQIEPDIILMDLRMPLLSGTDATELIVASGSQAKIIALTSMEDDASFHGALRAGVTGFLLKTSSRGELLHAIRQVHSGESILSPALITRILQRYEPALPPSPEVAALSDVDRELLRHIGEGLSNTEISEEMDLTLSTVKTYVSRLLKKLGARDRAQLVIIAYDNGIVTRRESR